MTALVPISPAGQHAAAEMPPPPGALSLAQGIDYKPEKTQAGAARNNDLELKGRFARYTSSFWDLVVTLLPTRYIWKSVEDINPGNFLQKPDPELKPKEFTPWKAPKAGEYLRRNFAALLMGGTYVGAIGYYTGCTYQDIKTLYSEAVGYELNKKPEEVNWHDLFFKSQNEALRTTRESFVKRSLARFAAAGTFFVPWHIFRDWPKDKPKFDANADCGVAGMAVELAWEGLGRKESFFDREQTIVGTSISNNNTSTHKMISTDDVKRLLLLHRENRKPYNPFPLTPPEREKEGILAERIADLLNQTYENAPRAEQASFSLGKFNYLIGMKMLDNFPSNLAFVELANRSSDMKEVKQAAAAIKSGQDATAVFKSFGIDPSHFFTGTMVEPAAVPSVMPTKISATFSPDIVARLPSKAEQVMAEKLAGAQRSHGHSAA